MKNTGRILVVDDEAVIREGVRRSLEKAGCRVETSASGHLAMEALQASSFDVVITDLKMPGMSGLELLGAIKVLQPEVPVCIMTGYASVETAVDAMKNGAFDYLSKPFTPDQVVAMADKALGERTLLVGDAQADVEFQLKQGFESFVGQSPQMRKVFQRIIQVASADSTVLITGESGTGKELVARAIQANSPRRDQPFVAVDCTSLAESLLESELFGHVKGSFTGAVQTKVGLFKVADGGTLFLDEVSNLSLTTQAKLLRVLQEREVTPIGGTQPQPFNVRLIAACNRNLKEMVQEGTFRSDLFFRLNIIPIDMPPLRERLDDLAPLVGHFVKKFGQTTGKKIRGLAPGAMAMLKQYTFPGNVRELENIIERAVVLAQGELIQPEDQELPNQAVEDFSAGDGYVPRTTEELKETKAKIRERAVQPVERAFVLSALERNDWNITRAAEEVGMLRPNFQALLKKQGICVRDRAAGWA